MGNRAIVLIFSMLLISHSAPSKVVQKKDQKSEDLAETLLKKHGSYRPSETQFFKDELPTNNRVDLDNDYFKISYPKCFNIEPLNGAEDDSETIKNVAALDLKSTKNCQVKDENHITVYFSEKIDKSKTQKFTENLGRGNFFGVFFAQKIRINDASGKLNYALKYTVTKDSQKHNKELLLIWEAEIVCPGNQQDSIFKIGYSFTKPQALIEKTLEAKKIDLPEDIRMIISSFKCK